MLCSFDSFRVSVLVAVDGLWPGYCLVPRKRWRLFDSRQCCLYLCRRDGVLESGPGNFVVDLDVLVGDWWFGRYLVLLSHILQVKQLQHLIKPQHSSIVCQTGLLIGVCFCLVCGLSVTFGRVYR